MLFGLYLCYFEVDEDHKQDFEDEIKRADVLVMIYSVESVDSIAHIYDTWLPKAQKLLGDRSKVYNSRFD